MGSFKKHQRYTLPYRLSDVIRLINVLSQGEYAFRTEKAIHDALRDKPQSGANWHEIAKAHPEFFRPTGSGNHYGLLIRTYFVADENEKRAALTVDQTQKQIDVAISLHDKEIQRKQMNGYKTPLAVAFITLFGVIISPFSANLLNANSNSKIESINTAVQQIKSKMDQIPSPLAIDTSSTQSKHH